MENISIGLGLIVIGVGIGIGLIGYQALQSSARQPEMKDDLRTMMILGAALIEGVAFFAAVICLLMALK
ncbi:MAG: ATP synthase F0 subunit C [Fibrobacter sp.]|nr:ATP synthase F0 subunit C [Fibrobacter sp.]